MMIRRALNLINQDSNNFNYNGSDERSDRLDVLRKCINDENYLHAAIQRLALIMSNELMEITQNKGSMNREGEKYGRKRRK